MDSPPGEVEPADSKDSVDPMDMYLGGKTLLYQCTICNNGLSLTTNNCLGDTGAGAYMCVSTQYARRIVEWLNPKIIGIRPRLIAGFDGQVSHQINQAMLLTVQIQGRTFKDIPVTILDLGGHDLIIGKKWFEAHDVLPDCRRHRLIFPPDLPPDHNISHNIKMDEAGTWLRHPKYQREMEERDRRMEKEELRRKTQRQNAAMARASPVQVQVLQREHSQKPDSTFQTNTQRNDPVKDEVEKMERAMAGVPYIPPKTVRRRRDSQNQGIPTTWQNDSTGPYRMRRDGIGWYKERPTTQFANFSATAFTMLTRREKTGSQVQVSSIHEIDKFIDDKRDEGNREDEETFKLIPDEYHDLVRTFSKEDSNVLPPNRPRADHKIEFIPDKSASDLGYSPLYKMSLDELEAVREYLVDNLRKGFIEPSDAPYASPVLFVKKADGGLRFCVDYRKLNEITKRDRYPLPLIEETLSRISQAKIFTKIDVRQAFHRIRIHPGDEDLTTFRTRYGAYRYKVLPFGLTNGPSTFQRYINNTLFDYLDDFCSAYVDDVLVYSDNLEDHRTHVRKVLERLRAAGLQADLKKSEFHVTETKFLGYIIGIDGIRVDPAKIEAILDWESPTNLKGTQSFLGFCNFYRKFIDEYSRIAGPLNKLTRKDVPFVWAPECEEAFERLKEALTNAPLLRHFQYGLPTRIETDASDGVASGVLTQLHGEDWHPVAYFSKTLQNAELNYDIHDREMLAVTLAMKEWRPELIGTRGEPFLVITDHQALQYFSTKQHLNSRQAEWTNLFSGYDFLITYRPGKENIVADALSRKQEDLITQKAKKEAQRHLTIFQPVSSTVRHIPKWTENMGHTENGIEIPQISCFHPREELTGLEGPQLIDRILKENKEDLGMVIYRKKADNDRENNPWKVTQGLTTYNGRLVVPDFPYLRTKIIQEIHDRMTTAHPGRRKTRKLVAERYWWPGLGEDCDTYVANCMGCRPAKVPRDKTPGKLTPLPIPDRVWRHLVMDFKQMPKDKYGFDNALVMVDRLGKRAWTIPCTVQATAEDAAKMYYEGPFRVFGVPITITSDRGPQFISAFMDELCRLMGVRHTLASPGHHETVGQAEIMNEYLDQRLRPYVSHYQDDWSERIPAMDHAQAALPHESTGMSPHEVEMGFPMPFHFDWENRTSHKELKELPGREQNLREKAQEHGQKIAEYVNSAKQHLMHTQQRMTDQANKGRRDPDFDIGDYVLILKKRQTWKTDRPSDKLDYPMTQQKFKIIGKEGNTYTLEVPSTWRASDKYHADRLRKYPNNPLPGQQAENPQGEVIQPEGDEEFQVEGMRASRTHYGKLQYQVNWRGWDPDDAWYPAENFKNSAELIRQYHATNPEAAGPPKRLEEWRKAAQEDRFDAPHPDDNKAQGSGSKKGRRRRA